MTSKALRLAATLIVFGVELAHADESSVLIDLCRQYTALPAPTGGDVSAHYIQLKSSCAGFLGSTIRLSRPDDGICRPDRINIDDLAHVYLAWAEQNQDKWGRPTRETIIEAFKDIYPCPKG
jgi:hypothetical protein